LELGSLGCEEVYLAKVAKDTDKRWASIRLGAEDEDIKTILSGVL
jgi:hypothetical protein